MCWQELIKFNQTITDASMEELIMVGLLEVHGGRGPYLKEKDHCLHVSIFLNITLLF
jgi:hypothetical protein